MLEDLIKSAKDHALERLSSPLLGAFVVAWSLINYKFFVILLSDASVTRTFEMIDTVAFPSALDCMLRGLLYPGLAALVYVFGYPYPAKFVYGFTQRRQREIVKLRREIEDETPLTIEDSRKLRTQFRDMEAKHREEVDRLSQELTAIKSSEAKPPKDFSTTTVDNSATKALTDSQLAIVRYVGAAGGSAPRGKIPVSRTGRTKLDFDVGELESMKLADVRYDRTHDDRVVTLTHEGRRLYVTLAAVASETSGMRVTE